MPQNSSKVIEFKMMAFNSAENDFRGMANIRVRQGLFGMQTDFRLFAINTIAGEKIITDWCGHGG